MGCVSWGRVTRPKRVIVAAQQGRVLLEALVQRQLVEHGLVRPHLSNEIVDLREGGECSCPKMAMRATSVVPREGWLEHLGSDQGRGWLEHLSCPTKGHAELHRVSVGSTALGERLTQILKA